MTHERMLKQELAFLREQANATDLKIARLENALEACEDELEARGVRALLDSAHLEREVLNELVMGQVKADTVSLEAAILELQQQLRRTISAQSQRWQHGHPTPSAYWEQQVRQAFLSELLGRYRAWKEGRPYYAPGDSKEASTFPEPDYALPWYPSTSQTAEPSGPSSPVASPPTAERLVEALERAGCRPDHLTVITEPDGFVLATGYAHSVAEREQCTQALAGVEGVQELLTGIVIADEARCPVCHNQRLNGRKR